MSVSVRTIFSLADETVVLYLLAPPSLFQHNLDRQPGGYKWGDLHEWTATDPHDVIQVRNLEGGGGEGFNIFLQFSSYSLPLINIVSKGTGVHPHNFGLL